MKKLNSLFYISILLLFGLGLSACSFNTKKMPDPDGSLITTLVGLSLSETQEEIEKYLKPQQFRLQSTNHKNTSFQNDLNFYYIKPNVPFSEGVDFSKSRISVEVRRRAPESEWVTSGFPLGTFVSIQMYDRKMGAMLLNTLKENGYEVIHEEVEEEGELRKEGFPIVKWDIYDPSKYGHKGNSFEWRYEISYVDDN